MDRLAPVPQDYTYKSGVTLESRVDAAVLWVRRVRSEGHQWQVTPEPSIPELYPNMTNTYDSPWSATKKQIAAELDELTLLWQVGYDKRNAAHETELKRWTDPRCSPETLGITGNTYLAMAGASTMPSNAAVQASTVTRPSAAPANRPASSSLPSPSISE